LQVIYQRLAIYQVLHKTVEHPSAELIYQQVSQRFSMISLGTVCKTLERFREVGLVQRVSPITEAARYEAATHPERYEHRHSYWYGFSWVHFGKRTIHSVWFIISLVNHLYTQDTWLQGDDKRAFRFDGSFARNSDLDRTGKSGFRPTVPLPRYRDRI